MKTWLGFGAMIACAACTPVGFVSHESEMETELHRIEERFAAQGRSLGSASAVDFSGLPKETTHVVFVVDTSGSMRDPNNDTFKPQAAESIRRTLRALPHLQGVQLMDVDGRYLAGTNNAWIPLNGSAQLSLTNALGPKVAFSHSNPAVGALQAVGDLYDGIAVPAIHLAVVILSDEFVATDVEKFSALVQRRLQAPPHEIAAVRIHAVHFPLSGTNPGPVPSADDYVRFVGALTELYDGVFIKWHP